MERGVCGVVQEMGHKGEQGPIAKALTCRQRLAFEWRAGTIRGV